MTLTIGLYTDGYGVHLFTEDGEGWMICHFSNISVHFVFCQLNFIVLFPFLIKYYDILFIMIVFWLGCDRPSGLL